MIRSYSEMIKLPTFEERFNYLCLNGVVSELTFGHNRFLNQNFYHSMEWRKFRRRIIIRDNGCDLGIENREIIGNITIHHINPITVDDIVNSRPNVMDEDNVICVSHTTHNAIHYGTDILKTDWFVERKPYDTCPWRVQK